MRYKTLFRLGLKAFGVLLVATGLQPAVTVIVGVTADVVANTNYLASWYLGMAVGGLLQIGLGLYLFFGGRWIVDLAIPSNRRYCHDCAYELRGLPAEGVCPECGTAYRVERPQDFVYRDT